VLPDLWRWCRGAAGVVDGGGLIDSVDRPLRVGAGRFDSGLLDVGSFDEWSFDEWSFDEWSFDDSHFDDWLFENWLLEDAPFDNWSFRNWPSSAGPFGGRSFDLGLFGCGSVGCGSIQFGPWLLVDDLVLDLDPGRIDLGPLTSGGDRRHAEPSADAQTADEGCSDRERAEP
jgi:hypothetical protein